MSHRVTSRAWLVIICVMVVSVARLPVSAQASGLTPQERRGREIYLRGVSPSGQTLGAILGDSEVELPASSLACVNCHGRDGAGRPEGGVTPSTITWEALTKPYGVTHASGRRHPPYTKRLVQRAITAGLDPAGHRLHAAMPRYRLAQSDAGDLIAYLKRLGKETDPGLTGIGIRLGVTLITDGPFAELSRSVKALLSAYFDEVNQQGGIFNRRIDLRCAESSGSPAARTKALRAAFDEDQVFAWVGAFTAGADEAFASLLREKEVPLVGALTLHSPLGSPPNPYLFYLSSGLKDQCAVLAIFAAERHAAENPPAAIIHTGEGPTREAVAEIQRRCRAVGWEAVEEVEVPRAGFSAASLVRRLSDRGTRLVFFLAPSEVQEAWVELARELDWHPAYFVPGSLAGRRIVDAPVKSAAQVFLSVPSLPADQTAEALAEYRQLAKTYRLPTDHLASQLMALASAKVLVEGLKRAGREVSREKLVAALESLYQFRTGLGPPVTFNANQRVGAPGAYVVAVDGQAGQLVPVSQWINPQ